VEHTDLTQELLQIAAALKDTWEDYYETYPFTEDSTLAEKIEAFVMPARDAVLLHYPEFGSASPRLVWNTVFLAVAQSGTHSVDELHGARNYLGAKYSE
jgi:hypothetical protein